MQVKREIFLGTQRRMQIKSGQINTGKRRAQSVDLLVDSPSKKNLPSLSLALRIEMVII